MTKKPHLLITGIRRPGDTRYRFRIYGNPGSDFPPVNMESTLDGLRSWMNREPAETDELAARRAGPATLPAPS